MKRLLVGILATAFSLVPAGSASAAFQFDRFITQGDSVAGWIGEPNAPPGATDRQSIRLYVNGSSSTDFDDAARALFKGFGSVPDPNPPSFDFKTSAAGASGGSARFLIKFSDGGKAELRPLTLIADQWAHVGGSEPNWDNTGGSCGQRTDQTYAQVLACHPGAAVTQLEVLNDSGWLHPGGFELLVDNITYEGRTLSTPAPPVLGSALVLRQVNGLINVRVGANSRARIEGTTTLPVGSFVDTRKGHARLSSSTGGRGRGSQAARFTGGVFRAKQRRKDRGLVDISLADVLDGCRGSSASLSGAGERADQSRRRRKRRRRLWGRGRGRYRTRGRYSSGAVRGTKWLTQDTCNSTLTLVREGTVAVRDFRRKKTIVVKAPGRYVARKKRR